MTQISLPWSGRTVGDATIAPYDDDEFSDYIGDMLVYDRATMGILSSKNLAYTGFLEVTNPAGLTIRVATGMAIVDGKLYRNSASVDNAGVAPGAGSNYYTIVLRKNFAAQTVRVAVLGPNIVAPPAVTQTDGTTWEISLATVRVTSASVVTITDTRTMIASVSASASSIYAAMGAVVIGGYQNTGYVGRSSVMIGGNQNSVAAGAFESNAIIAGYLDSMQVSSSCSAVISGVNNAGGGKQSVILGGDSNTMGVTILGPLHCAIIGGSDNIITEATGSVILGGDNNNIPSGASYNVVAGTDNTIAVNQTHNLVMGDGTTVNFSHNFAQGWGHTINNQFAAAFGRYAYVRSTAQEAKAGNRFAVTGDAQTSVYVLMRSVTHSTNAWFSLFTDNTAGYIAIPADTVFTFSVIISGISAGAAKSFGYKIEGVIENDGGVTAILGTPTVTTLYDADDVSFDAQAVADDPNDALLIQVRDSDGASDVVRWVARVETAEVSFP